MQKTLGNFGHQILIFLFQDLREIFDPGLLLLVHLSLKREITKYSNDNSPSAQICRIMLLSRTTEREFPEDLVLQKFMYYYYQNTMKRYIQGGLADSSWLAPVVGPVLARGSRSR